MEEDIASHLSLDWFYVGFVLGFPCFVDEGVCVFSFHLHLKIFSCC